MSAVPDLAARTVQALAVPAPHELHVVDVEDAPLTDGRFRVNTVYSGVSLGTELTWYHGTSPYLHSGWDAALAMFRADAPGTSYPVTSLGYMEVGRVVATRTAAVGEGDLVAMTYGHRTGHTADPLAERFVVLPPDLDPLLGVFVAHLGPICANGLLHAAYDATGGLVRDLGEGVRGRPVVVTGGGLIGLLVGLFARAHGAASGTVVDATPQRLAAASALGLVALDERDADDGQGTGRVVKERFAHGPGDRGADVVFQCRGQASALATALRCLRPQGVVVDLAFYPAGAEEVRLGEEFHHNGLSIRSAQIGRVPRGLTGAWDRARLSAETVALLQDHGELVRSVLVTEVLPFAEAPTLFAEVSAHKRHVLGAVLSF